MKSKIVFLGLLALGALVGNAQEEKRGMKPSDIYYLKGVSDPQVSPDGMWVAYSVSSADSAKDSYSTNIWMVSWDGQTNLQLTYSPESESSPKWSPDGKYLAFLSSRQESKTSQVWLLDRRGGEGKRITMYKGGVSDYDWSPDGKKMLLTIKDEDFTDTAKGKTPKPMVMERYQFKQDGEGYRFKKLYSHLYLYDLEKKKLDTLTKGDFNQAQAVWSPDGKYIAFVSNRTEDPDKNENNDICLMEAKAGSALKVLTTWTGNDGSPRFSPDSKRIAFTRSTSSENYIMYDHPILAVLPVTGGEPTLLSQKMDRGVTDPRWNADGKSILALVTDDRYQYLASFEATTGAMSKIQTGQELINAAEYGAGNWAVQATTNALPDEIYALENGNLRRLTKHTDSLISRLKIATVQGVSARAKDGNIVNGLLYSPLGADGKKPLPMIVFIHGGPVGQDDAGFNTTAQIFATEGYRVLNVNYRGSSGRGIAYTKSISGDWGHLEVVDLHAMVDEMVKQGLADSSKLGVGGWSYGGILTDYLIATDNRFKAAVSGAGVGFTLALYGVDQYIMQYDNEIGPPWKAKSLETYIKLGYPLLHADRIQTPTLFMVGEKDFNVPPAGSEQMYQALRSLGIPTGYVVYPGQFHGIRVPSYQIDRNERFIKWYNTYLKK